jgi:glycosyltransferase involved in cell wall biosynthesis
MGRLGLKTAKRLHIPIVYTYHTLITEYTHYVPLLHGLARALLIKTSRDFCNACDQIVTPSPSMAKILKSYGVRKPIEAIPTGIEIENYQNHFPEKFIRAQWDIPENRRILLYISRVAKEKNLDFLLKAMVRLIDNRKKKHGLSDVHLVLAGGGPELEHYKEMSKELGLENYISFTDMLKKEVANRYFGAAYIFVFPSITETQGIVITEAMAAGTPVVAIDKMGPSDLVTDGKDGFLTGLVINDFVAKIEKLLDDPPLHTAMIKNARKNAEEYSAEACAAKMEKLYEDTIQLYNRNNPR